MLNKRIIFMGTPEMSAGYLKSLIDNQFNVIACFTQPPRKKGRGMLLQNSPVHLLSLKENIPIFFPINFNSQDEINNLKKLKPDLIVVMGYGILLPKNILNIPTHGCINVHVSLLPKWRGSSPIEYAILNGDKTTGVSIFQLEEKLDTGPIIATKELKIKNNINKKKLSEELNLIGSKLLINTLPRLFNKSVSKKRQNEKNATYSKKISSSFRKINFYDDVDKVYNKIRAFSPQPSAWFVLNKERIKIINCSTEICNSKASIILSEEFHIGCNNGKIIPIIIQKEGKKPMKIKDFLRGFKFKIGQKVNV